MPYIPPEVVAKAKEMDLLTYLKNYEPSELVHFGGSTYCTRTHDSLKISNGKWCWFSRGIGGKTALDYLIKVREIPFTEAVEMIVGQATIQPPTYAPVPKKDTPKVLLLPPASRCATHAVSYLSGRGIDREVIDFCLATGRLYESEGRYHNVVFVGHDQYGKARYANLRGNINTPKTKASIRQVPMLGFVKEAFIMEREYQEALGIKCEVTIDGYTDFIFVNRYGEPQNLANLNRAIRRIIRDCNDEEFLKNECPEVLLPPFSCHSLRHTFTTRMCEAGVNVKVIQDALGHQDISTTLNIYADVTKELKREQFAGLDTFFTREQ